VIENHLKSGRERLSTIQITSIQIEILYRPELILVCRSWNGIIHVIYPAFFLYSLLDKLRLLWNVEWIHEVVNLVDSPPVAVEAFPPPPSNSTHTWHRALKTPDQIVDEPVVESRPKAA
jgi:hypothetical protein